MLALLASCRLLAGSAAAAAAVAGTRMQPGRGHGAAAVRAATTSTFSAAFQRAVTPQACHALQTKVRAGAAAWMA